PDAAGPVATLPGSRWVSDRPRCRNPDTAEGRVVRADREIRWDTAAMAWRRPLHAREDLLRTARRLLAQDSTRVLTLTGLPGVGTTSMARALVLGVPQQQEVPFVDGRRATEPGALSRMALEAAVASDLV